MIRRKYLKNSLQRIGQLVDISREEAILAIRTRRQILIAIAIMVIGALTFTLLNGPIPLKYKGVSIHDFSWFWRMR
jgi:hypothetical protein